MIVLFLFCVSILFFNLGDAALFEPDEGRNAEVAREILLLKDWSIPYYDFVPRLDKPIFYYWLIALSYKLFGVSEWSARLPSVLAALGCLFLTYRLARSLFGPWSALWSALILVTGVEFFALSRIVILDMTLTFFISVSLCCFFWAQLVDDRGRRKPFYVFMYPAMGAATLVKGPIGFVVPAMVIFSYLLFSKRWALVREMKLPLGISLFLLTVAPWYVLAELRSPGYLRYFLGEENFLRFLTTHFNRSEPWYYFILVLAVGFLPWTVLIPTTIADLWKRSVEGERLFLLLWVAVPLVFFSLSASKLPHYILPIYPPLSIVVGETVARTLKDSPTGKAWVLSLPALTFFLTLFVSTLAVLWPHSLPYHLQAHIHNVFPHVPIPLLFSVVPPLVLSALAIWGRTLARQEYLYFLSSIGFACTFLFTEPIVRAVSLNRSSKELAEKAAQLIRSEDQIVVYGRYLSSLPFYLRIQRPIWVVWSGRKGKVLGSDYVAKNRPEPAAGYGKVLYTHEEFAEVWKSPTGRLVVFIGKGDAERLGWLNGSRPKQLLQMGDLYLMSRELIDKN